MLVLTRKRDQSIMVGSDVEITVIDVKGDQVKLGIRAPSNVTIHRKEVFIAIQEENRAAAQQSQKVDLQAARNALLRPKADPEKPRKPSDDESQPDSPSVKKAPSNE